MKPFSFALMLAVAACGGAEPVGDPHPTEPQSVEAPAKDDCPCGEPDLDTPPPPAPESVPQDPALTP